MLLTFDDQHLLTVAQDGCLYTWKVYDREGRGIKREREVGFAEEVLVTKIDLEEKVRIGSNEEGHRNFLLDYIHTPGPAFEARYSLAAPGAQLSPAPSLPTPPCPLFLATCSVSTAPCLPRGHLKLCSPFSP